MDWQPHRLQAWLRNELGIDEAITVHAVEGGFSNENYLISCASRRWLLRKPPILTSHQAAHNVLREYRVLDVLQDTSVHVPRILASCNDRAVIGTPFILMDWVHGARLDRALPDSYRLSEDSWRSIGRAGFGQLSCLHQLDWQALGLQDLGCVEGFLQRQVERWMAQYRAVIDRHPKLPLDLKSLPIIAQWLQEHCPRADKSALLHGDFSCQNLLFSRQPPVRVLAVLDWELATLGDPRLDLAALTTSFEDAGMPQAMLRELQAEYGETMAMDITELAYFQVLAAWKRVVILVSRYTTLQAVAAPDDTSLLELAGHIGLLLERAVRMSHTH